MTTWYASEDARLALKAVFALVLSAGVTGLLFAVCALLDRDGWRR